MKFLSSIALVVALALVGCTDVYSPQDSPRSPINPTPTPTPVTESRVEFRVNGNPTSVRVRFSTPRDGLVQVVTTLPYVSQVRTTEASMFLSLDVTPISYGYVVFPFLSVQIFVNGDLFREATSSEFLLNTLSVNGTWRAQ